jgi:hypothetical protein
MRREIADRLLIVSRAQPPDPAQPRQEFDALRHAAEATGRAATIQAEIARVGPCLDTLAGAADRNASLADHLRQVADDIGRSTTAMKTAIAQGQAGSVGAETPPFS